MRDAIGTGGRAAEDREGEVDAKGIEEVVACAMEGVCIWRGIAQGGQKERARE